MKIKSTDLPHGLVEWITNPDPLEIEDVPIEDENGHVIGVIIQPNAYAFFLKKVEEREDEIDLAIVANSEPYTTESASDSKTLEELMNEDK